MEVKNRRETYLREIVDNLNGNKRELPIDCTPKTREEFLLSEIERLTRELGGGSSSTYQLWVGTQEEYDALTPKDPNTLYFIKKVE